jgi:hypothetical protein
MKFHILYITAFILASLIVLDVLFNESRTVDRWLRGVLVAREPEREIEAAFDARIGTDDDGALGDDDEVETMDCRERLAPAEEGDCTECREEKTCDAPRENNKCFRKHINQVLVPPKKGGKGCRYADGEVVYKPCLLCEDKEGFRTKLCRAHRFYTTNGEMANAFEQTELCKFDLVMALRSHCDSIETEVRRDTGGPYSCSLASYVHFQNLMRDVPGWSASRASYGAVAYEALKDEARLLVASQKRGEGGMMRIQPPRRRSYSEIFLYYTQFLRLFHDEKGVLVTNLMVRSKNAVRTVNLQVSYADLACLERFFGSENVVACQATGDMLPLADRGGRMNYEMHTQNPVSTGVRFRIHPPWLAFRRSETTERYEAFLSAHRAGPGYGQMTSVTDLVAYLQPPINNRLQVLNNVFFLAGIASSGLFFHCPTGDAEFAAAVGAIPAPLAVAYTMRDGTTRDTVASRLLHIPGHPEWLCFRHNPRESTYTPTFRPLFPMRTRMAIDLVEFYNVEGELRKETDGRARKTDELVLTLDTKHPTEKKEIFQLGALLDRGGVETVVFPSAVIVRRIHLPPGVSVEFDLTWQGPRTGTGRDEPTRVHEDAYLLEFPGEFDVYFSTTKFTLRLLPNTVLWDKFDRFVESTSSYEIFTNSADCVPCKTSPCESAPCKQVHVRRELGSLLSDPEKLNVRIEDKYRSHPRFAMWSLEPTGVLISHEKGFGNEFGTRKTGVAFVRLRVSFGIKCYVMTNIIDPTNGKTVVVEMKRSGLVEFEDPETDTVRAISGDEIVDFFSCLKDDAVLPNQRSANILHTTETLVQIEAGDERVNRYIYLPTEEASYTPTLNSMVNAVPLLEKSALATGVFHELPSRADDHIQHVRDVVHSVRVPRGTALVVYRGPGPFQESRDVIFSEGVSSNVNKSRLFPITDVHSYSLLVLDSFFVFSDSTGRFMRI